MLLLYLLVICVVEAIPQYPFNMYRTDNYQDGYCLFTNSINEDKEAIDSTSKFIRQITAYCLRISKEDNVIAEFNLQNTDDPSFNFVVLREQNITSHMLLSWSASIDLAERYEIFMKSPLNSSVDKALLFHNCSLLRFGPSCQFTFEFEIDKSFNKIVNAVSLSKQIVTNDTNGTCYKHHHCETFLSCLDWREICDGKNDCLDGSDEKQCWQLEVNTCADSEYQCHNGQCIPIEFYHDGLYHPDCLDQTDEAPYDYSSIDCSIDRIFRCEELMCRPGMQDFSCGNGQCTNGIDRCYNGRMNILSSDFCSVATACLMKLYDQIDADWCAEFCSNIDCIKDNCSERYEFRFIPPLLGHIRLIFSNNINSDKFILPDYVCYNETFCPNFLPITEHVNNLTCRNFTDLGLKNIDSYDNVEKLLKNIKDRFRTCLTTTIDIYQCDYSVMYRCENSTKCILKQRLLDGIHDCPFDDDETYNQSCLLNDAQQRFKCSTENGEKCFSPLVLMDGKTNCEHGDDEMGRVKQLIQNQIRFSLICDGRTDLSPILINGQNETDETECNHWPCNNTYSRCDLFWLCKDGADEANCQSSICPALHHECIFPNDTSNVSCLPIAQAGDDIDSCLGGTDERTKYLYFGYGYFQYKFHCWNDTKSITFKELCNKKRECRFNDDEAFCNSPESLAVVCPSHELPKTDVDDFFCRSLHIRLRRLPVFKLYNMSTYPLWLMNENTTMTSSTLTNSDLSDETELIYIKSYDLWRCNEGISIRIQMDSNRSELFCLCPPSYYGNKCQYQSQRVSLTLKVQVSSDWRNIFIFLVTLIDNERDIQSHDHIQYLPIQNCADKFNIYLLYSTRPKNASKNYSVQIDAFYQSTLNYRASWIFPLQFSFLPVNRLSVLLKVPASDVKSIHECWPPCIHGECYQYINNQNSTFCRCESGWSGIQCDINYTCDCTSGSLCIKDSICLCSPDRFGPRCHLFQDSCYPELCMNGGQCLLKDARLKSRNPINSVCICSDGYFGDRCQFQQRQTRIDISFHSEVNIPPLLLVHLIAVQSGKNHNRTSIMKKIGFDQDSLTFSTSLWFNLAIAQVFNNYYMTTLQVKPVTLAHISTEIIPSHRCRSISELFNDTFVNQHLLKRIKYYHFPCLQQSELICFYDDVQFCLCTLNRTTNCFEFDHNITYDCGGDNFCENEGYCFQNNPRCPTSFFCACHQCYFGSKCQFSTKGSTLSLDIILGYHIRHGSKMHRQPTIVVVAIALAMIIFVFGFINIFLSLITFREKETRNVGCGLYLFTSSIISFTIVIVFAVKFWLLLVSKIGSINSRSFLNVQCISSDFILRCLLSINDWLSACIAIERAVNVSKGINFNKSKSKQIAKWIILVVICGTSCTYIYDPLHREISDDEEEHRTWCITKYPSYVQVLDWILNIFHFSLPFSINCISAMIIIIVVTRTRSNSQKTMPFKEHLRKQLQHHKHLLISPLIIIILALPRLIISFLSGCMKSTQDSWLYLIGYFVSFIPSIMTFVVFVLPSEMYKKEFSKSIRRIWQ